MRKFGIISALLLVIFISACTRGTLPDKNTALKKEEAAVPGRILPALLRLEDVGPGGPYQSDENLHKLYAIAEYLHQEGVPFHVALIPRIMVPKRGFDASITDSTPSVKAFVTTIKNMQKMGGIVGIHGYTHQSGTDPSGMGFEFYDRYTNPSVPNTYQYARERIDKAMELFDRAGISPAFWETPHYTASLTQYPAFEEKMGLLYENFHQGEKYNNIKISDEPAEGYRGFITVPAPLGCIDRDDDVEKMIKKLDPSGRELASFFYHPFREFRYLYRDTNAKGEAYYIYDQKSPLHQLISAFKEKGFTFVSVNTLVRFIPAQSLTYLPFSQGDQVLTGRFESDGKKGILVWNKVNSQCRVYKYTASGYYPRKENAFADRGVWLKDLAPDQDLAPLTGDFNGDKKDDLLLYNPRKGTLQLALNRDGKFVPGLKPLLSIEPTPSACPLTGDFNGDGVTDIALYDPEKGSIRVALGTSGGFKQFILQYFDILKGRTKLLKGDFNGDGKDDIAVLDTGSGDWRVLLAGLRGYFFPSEEPWLKGWGAGSEWRALSSDMNGSGKSDLVLYNKTGQWVLATSDGKKFQYQGDFGPWGASQTGFPLVADLNGDNRADLVVVDAVNGKGYRLDTAISVF